MFFINTSTLFLEEMLQFNLYKHLSDASVSSNKYSYLSDEYFD